MFKKLKDKIAEEVKSSPSRIQQLAQVAQVIKDLNSSELLVWNIEIFENLPSNWTVSNQKNTTMNRVHVYECMAIKKLLFKL